MRLIKSAVLLWLAAICHGEAFRTLPIRGQGVQRIRNVTSSLHSGTCADGTWSGYSLLKTSPRPSVKSLSSASSSVAANSSLPYRLSHTISSPHVGSQGSCDSLPTVNIPGASLDWWYASTVYDAVSTFSVQFDQNDSATGWTLLASKTPFDVGSALGSTSPLAAETTFVTQQAYETLNATTGIGQVPDVIITPPPASITIPNYKETFAEGTAFVYFSTYEVISQIPTYRNGSNGCSTVTKTSPMVTPFAFSYTGAVDNSHDVGAGITGDVNPAFLGIVHESSAVAGSWLAAPTVVIVVQKVFAAEAALAASIERTETSLDIPMSTSPSFLSLLTLKTTGDHLPSAGMKGHKEKTETFLLVPTPASTKPKDSSTMAPNNPATPSAAQSRSGKQTMVPFVAHVEHSEITLELPSDHAQHVATTMVDGYTITATRIHQGSKPTTERGGGVGGVVSGVGSLIKGKPTNALQVLSLAEESIKDNEPAASSSAQEIRISGVGTDKQITTIIVAGTTLTANEKAEFDLPGSKTLTPGGTAVLAGTTLSLLPGGSFVVVNGHTEAVSKAIITSAPPLTIGGQVYHANSGLSYVIEGKTLTPGGAISIGGTFVSLGQGLSTVVIDGITEKIGPQNTPSSAITLPPKITIGGEKFTAKNGATYDINGKTLEPGRPEAVTIDGKTYIVSLAHGATVIEIETLGPNGVVTATVYETLYPGGSWKSIDITRTVTASESRSGKPGASHTSSPAPNLQNSAALAKTHSSACLFVLGSLVISTLL